MPSIISAGTSVGTSLNLQGDTSGVLELQTNNGTPALTLESNGNITIPGTGKRILGDFSNATLANRVYAQTSTANATTSFGVLPNGTSPTSAINVFANSDPTNTSFGQFRASTDTGDVRVVSGISGTGTYLPLTMYTGGSERLRIDTAGNLGLGVTPTSWPSSWKALEIGFTGNKIASGSANDLSLYTNTSWNGSAFTYNANGLAARYNQNAGVHYWFTAPSGTAGNAITFTQAMTLDASGNLMLGTTTNSYGTPRLKLAIPSGTGANALHATDGVNGDLFIDFPSTAVTRLVAEYGTGGVLVFANGTGKTERMRIDSSGNLLVGKTVTTYSTTGTAIGGGNVSSSKSAEPFTAYASTNNANMAFYRLDNNTYMGGIFNQSSLGVSYSTASDYRLKENIAPMTGALAKVQALKPVTYKWKADGSDGQGFIAHELQAVVPDAVTGEKDAVDADGNPVYQGIDTSFLVATLTAAIQELNAKVDALQTELNTLKGV